MAQDAGESDLLIQIEPTASSFFAGEVFQARITLTNTCRPVRRRGTESPGGWSRGHHAGASIDSPLVVQEKSRTFEALTSSSAVDGEFPPSGRRRGRLKQIGPDIPVRRETGNDREGVEGTSTSGGLAIIAEGRKDLRTTPASTRARSAELLDGTMTPQEMVWSLTQRNGQCGTVPMAD
jgi:hypothetical protein